MAMSSVPTVVRSESTSAVVSWKRVVAIVLGASLVAIGAQIAVPLPGSPVPVTLQGLAVLLVGGTLGAGPGAAALVLYLALGAMGFPVFAPTGLPGVARLLGPTGGYLLAFPVAAAVTGAVARRAAVSRCLLACFLGMVIIHTGGIAQLSILTGGLALPFKATLPLLLADLMKVVLGALVIANLRSHPSFSR